MLDVQALAIPDVRIVRPRRHGDDRGFLAETYNEATWGQAGVPFHAVQENHAFSARAGTVRGLHFQKAPHAQAKLLRVLRGRIFDVALDMRPTSPHFGQHVAVTLTADDLACLYIPAGFAHGFCTLSDDSVVLYKMSSPYAPESEGGVMWNDPDLKIDWPDVAQHAILSGKDEKWPRFRDVPPMNWS